MSGCTYETPADVSDSIVCTLLDLHKMEHQQARQQSVNAAKLNQSGDYTGHQEAWHENHWFQLNVNVI